MHKVKFTGVRDIALSIKGGFVAAFIEIWDKTDRFFGSDKLCDEGPYAFRLRSLPSPKLTLEHTVEAIATAHGRATGPVKLNLLNVFLGLGGAPPSDPLDRPQSTNVCLRAQSMSAKASGQQDIGNSKMRGLVNEDKEGLGQRAMGKLQQPKYVPLTTCGLLRLPLPVECASTQKIRKKG